MEVFFGFVPTQVSSIFSHLSRGFFCGGFSWPLSVSCSYVSKNPLIFLDVFCDVFLTILFFRLSWSSIKNLQISF